MRYLLSCFLLCFFVHSLHAEFFQTISLEDGLSQPSVISITQDALGRMWFGTREGVNIYDGQKIQTYKGEITTEDGTPRWLGNVISHLCSDSLGNVYLIADANLFSYNVNKASFRSLTQDGHTTALTGRNGFIWYIEQNKLYCYHPAQGTVTMKKELPDYQVTNLASGQNMFLLSTEQGAYTLSEDMTDIRCILPKEQIYAMYQSSEGELWIGTRLNGLYRYSGNRLEKIPYTPQGNQGIRNNQIREFVEDEDGNIWFGTFFGLQKYNRKTQCFDYIKLPLNAGGLTHPSIFSLYKDRQGLIWTGSYFGGVNYFKPSEDGFIHYDYPIDYSSDTYYSYIGEMTMDKYQNLWMSTDGGGVRCIDRHWNLKDQLSAGGSGKLPHNNVKSICYDPSSHSLFIGTHLGGLARYDIAAQKFHNYTQEKSSSKNPYPGSIVSHLKMWKGKLLLSSSEGFFMLDPKKDKFQYLFAEVDRNVKFEVDEKGTIYYVSSNGIEMRSVENPQLNHLLTWNELGAKVSVSSLLVDKNEVYITTLGSGLLYYNMESGEKKCYSSENSKVPSNYCYNIKRTQNGNFLLTGDKGIVLFNPNDNSFKKLAKDYAQSPIINGCGIYVSKDNHLFVGDTKGITFLHETDFVDEVTRQPLYFSELQVNNQLVKPNDKSGILSETLPFTDHITLKYNQNNLLFGFAHSDYINKYVRRGIEYKLEGFDDGWTYTSIPQVRYTNLSPGTYLLKVRIAGKKQLEPAVIAIHIETPWYDSWGAWSCYILLFLTIVITYLKIKSRQRVLSLSLDKERFEKQQMELLNQNKLVFFTNVSHELRTPLTLILSHVETILQQQGIPTSIYNVMLKIRQNAMYMNNLVTELLDFRKITQNQLVLQLGQYDLHMVIKEVYLSFSDYARQRNIQYSFSSISEEAIGWFDVKQMEKVFFNLLSNAFKYTPDHGTIQVCLSVEDEQIKVSIKDSGIGLTPDDASHIFDRFFQADSGGHRTHQSGTGIGLALTKSIVEKHHGQIQVQSELGKGSTFTVLLSVKKEIYALDSKVTYTTEKIEENQYTFIPEAHVEDEPQILKLENVETDEERSHSVLLVEDNLELLDILKNLFAPFYKVFLAHNGKEGLSMAFEYKPELIVSDIMMPEMSGTELCLQIKSNIDLCHIPIILLTALNGQEQNIEGLNRGADDYITKPFNSQLLLARANNLVRNRLLIQHQLHNQPVSEVDLTSINPLDQKLLRKTAEVIEQNMDDPDFDVPKLCAEIGVGRSLLYSKFKALTGMTPNQFILSSRLKNGATLLKKYPTMAVSEISDRCGFSSPVYFSRCFKSQYGDTPQVYRKKE